MDRLDALGDPAVRAVLLAVRGRARPVTADELAPELRVHRNVVRSRLERLAAAGLVEVAYERRTERTGPGSGRPAKTYAAAPETRSLEFPERRWERVLGLLVEQLPTRGRPRLLADTGVAFGRELARAAGIRKSRSPAAALESVAAAVRSLGYQASVESAGPDGGVIVSPTCPLRPLVFDAPATSGLDRGMWRGLVESALSGTDSAKISCTTHDCAERHSACRIAVRLRR
jgi:predicted ArsR family transcriptional regulator